MRRLGPGLMGHAAATQRTSMTLSLPPGVPSLELGQQGLALLCYGGLVCMHGIATLG